MNKNKKIIVFIALLVILLISFMLIARFYVKADEFANMVTIDNAEITSIKTGTGPFDNVEGAGNDISEDDRIIRSFDNILYNVKFSIKAKDGTDITDFESRKVEIIVSLSDEDIKYVSFESYNHSMTSGTFLIDNDGKTARYITEDVNTYGDFNDCIVLKVKNAPNGYEIKPSFKIKETTDLEDAKELNPNNDIVNYMPTIVSSKSNIDIISLSSDETQIGQVDNQEGRYLTFGIGLRILGDNKEKGIKGMLLPSGDISFDVQFTQNNGQELVIDEKYIGLYKNEKIGELIPAKLDLPYNINNSKVSVVKKTNNIYTIIVNDYNEEYNTITATGNILGNNNGIFTSIVLPVFSKRVTSNSKNDIIVTMDVNKNNSVVAKTINQEELRETTISNNSASILNKYQDTNDYNLSGIFINKEINKNLSTKGRGYSSATRGEKIAYKSTFNYKNSALKTGVSQIIKIDPKAFELIKLNNDDYTINLNCNNKKCNITEDDFIVKYVTLDFSKDNYEVTNYSNDTLDKHILDIDKDIVLKQCKIVKDNYENLTEDQIMNLYGGPCIKAKDNSEKIYTDINKIGDEKISKIILETKEGKILDEKIDIDFVIGLRIRNIPDITKTYQVVTSVKSKDTNNYIYFAPTISIGDSSITNYDNYKKTTYKGSVATVSDKTYGDSLKIISYSAKNDINITNKKTDGSKKTSYITSDNEVLTYKTMVDIVDNSINVGAEDVWYIKELNVVITLPKELEFKQNNNYLTPTIVKNNDETILLYKLSYTKPNTKIEPIYFDAVFKPNIKGANNKIVVTSTLDAINVNNEKDTSIMESLTSEETIYVTGSEGIIVTENVGDYGKIIEKNKEFSYKINAYNSSDETINNINIMSVLPNNNDDLGSKYNGSYTVKVNLPSSLQTTKVYCYNDEISKLSKEVDSTINKWEECSITEKYVNATAIKFENIKLDPDEKTEDITISLKPSSNDYGDKYSSITYSKSEKLTQNSSQKTTIRVVNRGISGQVFIDKNQNGIKDDDSYLKDVSVSLCKLDSYNKCKEIDTTLTDENGKYSFNKLEVGRYKVNFLYNSDEYDVTNRYFTNDTTIDSDAYKISSEVGKAEISGKQNGIRLTKDIEKQENLDIGLIERTEFEIAIKKGINNIEINNNGLVNSYKYNFEKTVSLNVKNPRNLTGKIVYGFEIINNKNSAGYVKLIEEDIPSGMSFNPNYEENKNWFSVDGKIFYDGLKNVLIKPGETKTFEIALDMDPRNEAGILLNQVSIVELEPYKETTLDRKNDEYVINNFEIGSSLTYGGVKFHVINDDGTNVTLLADETEIKTKMGHTANENDTYKWSESLINKYINNTWINNTSLDKGVLVENEICDDASGLQIDSYGGSLKIDGTCQSQVYNKYKVRLITTKEFETLLTKLNDVSFLLENEKYWTMNSSYVPLEKDEYGNTINSVKNYAISIDKTTNPVSIKANQKYAVRPVITVPKANIILQ